MTAALRILCVDDEPDIRELVAMALAIDPALDVRLAGSGSEALAMLDDRAWTPDIALIDLMMAGMTGTDLMAAIRTRPKGRDLPIIFMTASNWQSGSERYMLAGALGLIGKPFDPMTLAQTIRDYWSQVRRNDRVPNA